MNDSEPISVHDNILVSYEMFCERRELILRTEFRDRGEPYEYTDVVFTGVAAYDFRHDSEMTTVIFDIETRAADEIYAAQADEFTRGLRYGWPGDWAKSLESAREYFRTNAIHGYTLSSSCGMNGWILARDVLRRPRAATN